MRIRRLGVLAAATFLVAAFTAPANADLLINVDKSTQRMTVSVDGVPRYVWPVSTGIAKYDTPSGSFTPFRMEKDHFSKEWDDAPMPYSIFFTKMGHAIHGTNHSSIGRPASHGCVRLSVAHAAKLWALVKDEGMSHTKVVLDGELPPSGALVAKRHDAGRPLQIEPEQTEGEVTGSVPPDGTYSRGWNSDDGYYAASPRYDDDGPRYAYRRPYVAGPEERDDDPPPSFPFFFGR